MASSLANAPSPSAMGRAVPASRSTPRVGRSLPARSRPRPSSATRVRSVPTSGDAASIESGGAPAPAASPPAATDVRVRVLRGETDIPRIVTLCSAVFKEVAVPMPAGADDPVLLDLAEFLESRYEQAMIKDLTSVITRNMREKRRAANQQHAEVGRVRARATARELQALQRTRTSVDALTTEQLCEMRRRITDEIEIAVEQDAKEASAEYVKRRRARQWIQLVADGIVPGGVSTGLVSVPAAAVQISDAEPGAREIIASATLQVCVPDAPFPPPFPTSRPYRSYLANMAVAPEARRSGVATKVIAYSERLTKMWGFDEMWLHVNIDNPGAQKLYEGMGYERVGEDPWWYLDRRYLMKKTLR